MRIIKALRRTIGYKGEVYGYQCVECKGWWKIYQNEYHQRGCKTV